MLEAVVRARAVIVRTSLALLGASGCGEPTTGVDVSDASRASASVVSSSAPAGVASTSAQSAAAAPAVSTMADPSASLAEPAPPRFRRGVWLWEFGKRGPSAERSAEILEHAGVQRVFIKGPNGPSSPRWKENAKIENLRLFTQRKMEVWIFGYVYGEGVADQDGKTWGTIAEQVKALVEVAKNDEVTGVIVDAEEEFKVKDDQAVALCKGLRAALPAKQIGYTTFGWLKPNKKFPYKAFDRHCGDVFMPQVYWAFGWPGGVRESLARMEADVKELGLTAPLWPIQSNEKNPSVEDLELFFELAGPNASVFYLHKEDTPQTERLGKLTFR